MKKILLLVILAFVSFGVCEAQSTTKSKTKRLKSGRITWRLKLDFISKGGGIDNATYDKIIAYAAAHPKQPNHQTNTNKGREGEKTVYFSLAELTEDEQYAFVEEVTKMIPDRKMVKLETTLPRRKVKQVTAVGEPGKDVAGDVNVQTRYRLILSFISKGAGVDNAAEEKVKSYLAAHAKKPAYEVKMWGREGERDYIMKLQELSAEEQAVLVKDLKKLISSSDMVFVKENEVYVKKGR